MEKQVVVSGVRQTGSWLGKLFEPIGGETRVICWFS